MLFNSKEETESKRAHRFVRSHALWGGACVLCSHITCISATKIHNTVTVLANIFKLIN